MKHYNGLLIIAIGLIGYAGAMDTGYGWCTSSAITGIGITLLLLEQLYKHEKGET